MLADRLKAPIAIIDKRRPRPNVAEVMNIVGNIEGKTAILIDDIIDTAGTITLAANALVENGAKCVQHAYTSFAPFSTSALAASVIVPAVSIMSSMRIAVFPREDCYPHR